MDIDVQKLRSEFLSLRLMGEEISKRACSAIAVLDRFSGPAPSGGKTPKAPFTAEELEKFRMKFRNKVMKINK